MDYRFFIISVPMQKHGYSFGVKTKENLDNVFADDVIINMALEKELFEDESDSLYSIVEEAKGDEPFEWVEV